MALLTPLSATDVARLGAEFAVDIRVVEPLAAGSVNSNFRLELGDGRQLFARIYEEQGEAGAHAELALLDELERAGVPTARALTRADGGRLSRAGEKPLAVYAWVDGEIRCQARVSVDDMRRLGEALARVHLAPVGQGPAGRFNIAELRQRLERVLAEAPEYRDVVEHIRERLAEHEAARDPELPRGLIHGDLFRDNVLWRDGQIVALLDFESACHGAYVYDIAVCLHSWCYGERFEPALLRGFVEGYTALRELSAAERTGLPTEAAIAALRFAVTRITDYSMRAAPGQPPLRDYRRFLARLSAVEAGLFDEL